MVRFFTVRFLNWLFVKIFYRRQIFGLKNIPKEGGALFVANHVAYSDPSILLATVDRPISFFMYRAYYNNPFIRFFAKRMNAIPVSPKDPPKVILNAFGTARELLEKGEFVGIFAEGALTRIGNLLPFNRGFEKLMRGVNAPIIPVHLDAVWGSFFSHRGGKAMRRFPKRIPYPVTITIGKPLPSNTKAWDLRTTIQDLGAEAFQHRTHEKSVLSQGVITNLKRGFFKQSVADSSGRALSRGALLSAALHLGSLLTKLSPQKNSTAGKPPMMGVLLPPSIPALLANVALTLRRIVPVNLNFTASSESINSAIAQCEISTIITSRAFIEKAKIPATPQMIFFEDLQKELSSPKKFLYYLAALLTPTSLLERWTGASKAAPSDLATVIFSSGSTGEPKGVMLSHQNITSNITGLSEVFQLEPKDCILGVLPFFHSFGFTGTLWLPLLSGIRAVYHANPIDAGVVGEIAEKHRATVLLSTPTFLMAYQRKCTPEQFKSLHTVVVGAEKLKEKIAQAFFEKFGVIPMEGYGCTELSPVAMLNIRNFKDERVDQVGHKPGSVGHPIPSVTIKVVDPETFAPLGPDTEGLILIKGPNVMMGYLGNPKKTAEVIKDGWYITGDIGKVDEAGFVTLTDRLSRFSKIGGEMVPHVKIEEEIQSVLGAVEQVCVVAAVPHEKKGEQIVLLHTVALDPVAVTKTLSERGLPNLWIPKRENFFQIEKLPMLGSGKIDLKEIKRLASGLVKD